ncbi:unnamed protein product [Musa banksii]
MVGSDITGEDTVGTCGTTNGSAAGTPTVVRPRWIRERWNGQVAWGGWQKYGA